MRRAVLTLTVTIVGLVALLQFKTHPSGITTGGLASLGPVPGPSHHHHRRELAPASPPASPTTRPRHRSSHGATARATQRATTPTPAPRTISATGQTVQTQYGPVQVRIVKVAGRLTNVTAVQLPSSSSRSSELAAYAAPILRSEALRANSAHIDTVSGATYTSNGYAQSLQSALDNA